MFVDKATKERLHEIREAIKKYGFDKILGQTAKNKIRSKGDDEANELLWDDEIPVKLRLMLQDLGKLHLTKHEQYYLHQHTYGNGQHS